MFSLFFSLFFLLPETHQAHKICPKLWQTLQELLRYVAEVVRPQWLAEEHGLDVVIEIAAHGAAVSGDAKRDTSISGNLDQSLPLILHRGRAVGAREPPEFAVLHLKTHIAWINWSVVEPGIGQSYRHREHSKAVVRGGVALALQLVRDTDTSPGGFVKVNAVQPRAIRWLVGACEGSAPIDVARKDVMALCGDGGCEVVAAEEIVDGGGVSVVVTFPNQDKAREFVCNLARYRAEQIEAEAELEEEKEVGKARPRVRARALSLSRCACIHINTYMHPHTHSNARLIS